MPFSWKSNDAIYRLLAAVIATNPTLRLDYQEIANHLGNGITGSALEHRFRPIKDLAKRQKACVENGQDPSELALGKGAGAETTPKRGAQANGAIHQRLNESTPDGIAWQVRGIKKMAEAMNAAVANGTDPAQVSTPSGKGRNTGPKTPGSRASKKTGSGAVNTPTTMSKRTEAATCSTTKQNGSRKRSRLDFDSEDDDESGDADYDELNSNTPSGRKSKMPKKWGDGGIPASMTRPSKNTISPAKRAAATFSLAAHEVVDLSDDMSPPGNPLKAVSHSNHSQTLVGDDELEDGEA